MVCHSIEALAARLTAVALVAAAALGAAACRSADAAAPPPSRAEIAARARAITDLGRRLFADPSLSASGAMSCASCHDPSRAFGPPDDTPVRFGGPDLSRPGHRAVPSLRYLHAVPAYTDHFFDADTDESIDNGPAGGLMWDGRLDRAADQARIPLLSPFEMANASPADVVARAARAPYAAELRALFGADVLDDPVAGFDAITFALETFQQDYEAFYPYTSKYDAYLAGRAALTEREARGLAAFEDPARGNCARCHFSRPGRSGEPPLFTDFGFIALGVPRNPAIPANADPQYFDLGLCGPDRTDRADRAEYCGLFRTPSLRNVATRRVFFHNGVVTDLRRVVAFYVERDTHPERWYPRTANGGIRIFDDLPARYHGNVDVLPPFGGRPGDPPPLTPEEIDDIVVFLGTLTDGYDTGPMAMASHAQPGESDAP